MSYLKNKGTIYQNNVTNINSKNKHIATDAFMFKGQSFTITTIQILSSNLGAINSELDEKLKINASFFLNAPVVIDLKSLDASNMPIHLPSLKKILLEKNIIPVGIINANSDLQEQAINCKLAILQNYAKNKDINQNPTTQPEPTEPGYSGTNHNEIVAKQPNVSSTSTIVNENVRSGQQVYAKGGDLIVMASVSNGAELIADGHIHVYGALRGRAMAGVNGDASARIFCQKLEAELVSIAGQYILRKEIKKLAWSTPAQIYIANEELRIENL